MEDRVLHWKKFYEDGFHRLGPSPFCEWLGWEGRGRLKVLDVGCGCGADSAFIAGCGHDVTAIDSCPSAGQQCGQAKFQLGSCTRIDQEDVDVIYSRWLLHALTPDEQESFLVCSFYALRPGGLIALEFRSSLDDVEPGHYRRAVPLGPLVERMIENGFSIMHQSESRGRSVRGNDDPLLARIVAKVKV